MTTRTIFACMLLIVVTALAWPQFMGPPRGRLQFPTPASPDEAAITVAYRDMTLADVLKDFGAKTGYLVTAAPDQVDQKLSVSNTGKPFDILGRICTQIQCAPRTAIYLVPEAKMPRAQPKFDLPQTTLTINAKDSDTKQVLDMIAKAAGFNLFADEDVLKANPGVTVSFASATVEEVLDKLASQLKCHVARGMYLEHVDPGAEMEKFLALPPQQQEAMMVAGIDMMKDRVPSQQQVQQGMSDGLKDFWNMPAAEQGRIVDEVTKRMTQMGDIVSGFSPEGQAKVMAVIRPFLKSGIGVYLRLTPAQQATFAPAIKAMEHFPGGAPQ